MPNQCCLQHLTLENYRCFPALSLSFDDRMTVFVAPNGGGKTAVLDGIALALRLFVDTVEGRTTSRGFEKKDIRRLQAPHGGMETVTPVRLRASGDWLGQPVSWTRERESERASRTTTAGAQELRQIGTRLRRQNQEWVEGNQPDCPLYPLVSYYGTGRLWSAYNRVKSRSSDKTRNARDRGYTDCLSSASHYKYFLDWFRRFSYEARRERHDETASPHDPQQLLRGVSRAVDTALRPSGWKGLEWDFAEEIASSNHPMYGRLPIDFLSDGIRNMVGLVADIAHRAARLNPQFGENAATQTPGIVLIDEVDMHLHPEWQQVVLRSLGEAFPLLQFIVTTHSPQVLTTLRRENVRVFEADDNGQWTANPPTMSPLAHESGDALAHIMGVHPRPVVENILADLHAYEQFARNGRRHSEEAKAIRIRLDAAGFEFNPADLALFDFLARKAAESGAGKR